MHLSRAGAKKSDGIYYLHALRTFFSTQCCLLCAVTRSKSPYTGPKCLAIRQLLPFDGFLFRIDCVLILYAAKCSFCIGKRLRLSDNRPQITFEENIVRLAALICFCFARLSGCSYKNVHGFFFLCLVDCVRVSDIVSDGWVIDLLRGDLKKNVFGKDRVKKKNTEFLSKCHDWNPFGSVKFNVPFCRCCPFCSLMIMMYIIRLIRGSKLHLPFVPVIHFKFFSVW